MGRPRSGSSDFLDDLNPRQREAATYTGGPLLVLAGAGSGKTRCLTYRFAYLVRSLGLDPDRILAITFTNKAAREMRQRIARLLGQGRGRGGPLPEARPGDPFAAARPEDSLPADRPGDLLPAAGPGDRALWVSTFHSACARLLRRYGERVGLGPNFVIYDEDDQVAVMKRVLEEQGWDESRWPARGLLAAIGRAKDELVGPAEYARRARDYREERVAQAYGLYQARLEASGGVDFDDLIFKTVTLLRENDDILSRLRERFRHVLIDEYQDTNHAQYVFADLLAAEHRNLCVVGDDDQSIYRWRGADIRNVLEFEQDYPDARVIRLEQNYRSTKTILAASNRLIAHNENRKGKELWTENETGDPVIYYFAEDERMEAEFVAGEVLGGRRTRGLAFRSFAVLYRTHAQSRAFEDVFMRRAVPYQVVGGVRFYERKEIKDVLAYLRIVLNPADELSLERALGAPRRGIGPVLLARLREAAAEVGGRRDARPGAGGLYAGIRAAAAGECEIPGLGPKLRSELERFVGLIESLAASVETLPVPDMVREVAEESGMMEALRLEGTPEAASRMENIRELATVAADFARTSEDPSLSTFLETASLLADIDVMRDGDDGVILMTVHNAKGLEFPNVFIVGLEQGLFPHSRSLEEPGGLEEERRLCYVAMTRAMKRLYVTHARERQVYGYSHSAEPSIFLTELPRETLFVASPTVHRAVAGPPEDDRPARAVATAESEESGAKGERWCPGERVVHPEWGEGVIVGLHRVGSRPGSPGEVHLRVAFAGRGLRTFPAAEAQRRER
ncbi:MAG: UvrD-helicase domain-containing protein [Bacillota bacterium]